MDDGEYTTAGGGDTDDGLPAVSGDETDGDPGDGEAVLRYELDSDEPASVGVVTAVADATSRPIASLEPLADVVDTDALDSLVDHAGSGQVRVSFEYAGVIVTVDSTRTVVLHR